MECDQRHKILRNVKGQKMADRPRQAAPQSAQYEKGAQRYAEREPGEQE
jgi:hypothetical protein